MRQSNLFSFFLFSIFATLLTTSVAAQTYSGQGFAGSVRVTAGANPIVTASALDTGDLPATGGTIDQASLGTYVVPGGLLTLGDRTVTTSGVGNSSTTSSSVDSVNLGALGITNLVQAGVVTANTSAVCPSGIHSANSSIANLIVAGTPIVVTGAPNQTVTVDLGSARVLTVVINERIVYPRSITANALHITVSAPLISTTIDVVVASARSGINCGLAPVNNLYSGRGTGVRVDQGSLLIPYLSTIVADTGWLPSTGTAPGPGILSGTANAGVPSILSTGTAFSTTQGGSPAGVTSSTSQVEDLGVDVDNPLFPIGPANVLTLSADVLESETQCQCSLGVPSCTGDSDVTDLSLNALGTVLNLGALIDTAPNTEIIDISIPLLATVRIVANEQVAVTSGTFSAIDVTALRIQIGALTGLLLSTDTKVAKSHSGIACSIAPSSAPVTLSGRVSDLNGRAISRAAVAVTDSKGATRTVMTNSFGYYSVKDLPSAETYIVSATARGYTFRSRVVSLEDDLSGFDLTPEAPAGKVAPSSSKAISPQLREPTAHKSTRVVL